MPCRHVLATALLLLAAAAPAAAQPAHATLVQARTLYNEGKYDEAIAAASAISSPTLKDGARLVEGRAYLERFRHSGDTIDLSTARNDFRTLDPARLDEQERVQLLVGLGESLYLDNLYGPAADLFDVALGDIGLIGPDERNQVLDWWASALDAEAQRHEMDHRAPYYQRIVDRMREAQREDPRSTTAAYWTVAAERGLGQLDRAWSDAIAYWVRAPLMDRGDGLRTDLDQLVVLGIIPDRARELAPAPDDAATTAADLRAEWEVVKQKWGS
jgi:hypothetical protein